MCIYDLSSIFLLWNLPAPPLPYCNTYHLYAPFLSFLVNSGHGTCYKDTSVVSAIVFTSIFAPFTHCYHFAKCLYCWNIPFFINLFFRLFLISLKLPFFKIFPEALQKITLLHSQKRHKHQICSFYDHIKLDSFSWTSRFLVLTWKLLFTGFFKLAFGLLEFHHRNSHNIPSFPMHFLSYLSFKPILHVPFLYVFHHYPSYFSNTYCWFLFSVDRNIRRDKHRLVSKRNNFNSCEGIWWSNTEFWKKSILCKRNLKILHQNILGQPQLAGVSMSNINIFKWQKHGK